MEPKTRTKTELAASLGVSRSSLYYNPKMPDKDLALKALIEKTWYEDEFPEYGHRRIAIHLGIGKKRIKRVMNKYQLKPPKRRFKKPSKPKDQDQPEVPFPNIIKTLCPIRPGVVWSSDFTYIPWQGGFIYLATVMDIFNREIVGWHVLSVHTVALIEGVFSDALSRRDSLPICFHSDQGSEYKELKHLENVQQRGIRISMSKKSSPWENGYQESYYSNFKLELGDSNRFETLGELIVEIHRLINRYNNQRIHTSLGCSPIQFKEIYYKKHSTRVMQSVS
jgi:transposase InsO family protein